jgi:hypothetical protein
LKITHVSERLQFVGILIPTGIEGQYVVLEHALEQPDYVMIAILHYEPILCGIPTKIAKA